MITPDSDPEDDSMKFCEFMVEHYEPAKDWVDPLGYCRWHMSHGFMAAVVGEDGNIVALGCARPVDRAGFGVLPFYWNEDGSCMHIDLIADASDDERAVLALRDVFIRRFGPRETVTLFRGNESAIHIYQYNRFWRHTARFKKRKHYGTTKQSAVGS